MKYIILLCVILLPTYSFAPNNNKPLTPYSKKELDIRKLKCSKLTTANVKQYMILLEIEHPEKVLAQFALETGWGTSYVCKTFNNLFGFRNNRGYMKYKHWSESVESYKRFQLRKYKGGDYYKFLCNIGYAEDSTYIQKLKQFKFKV